MRTGDRSRRIPLAVFRMSERRLCPEGARLHRTPVATCDRPELDVMTHSSRVLGALARGQGPPDHVATVTVSDPMMNCAGRVRRPDARLPGVLPANYDLRKSSSLANRAARPSTSFSVRPRS